MFSVRLFAAQSSSTGEVPEMSVHFGFLAGTCSNRSTSGRIRSVLGKVVMMKFSQGVTGSHRGVPSPVPHPGEQQVKGPRPSPVPQGTPGWQLWCHGQVTAHPPLCNAVNRDLALVAWGER